MKAPSRLSALLGLIVATALVAAVGVLAMDKIFSGHEAKKDPFSKIGGPFTLVNDLGKTVTEANFSGRFMLVFFGYSRGPDVCPTALRMMTDALNRLGDDQRKVVPVFITVDPERDTPQVLKKYVARFNPRLIGLTGSKKQILAVTSAYKVYAAQLHVEGRPKDEYAIDHSSFIYFIGPDSRYRAIFGNGTTPKTMADKMRKFL